MSELLIYGWRDDHCPETTDGKHQELNDWCMRCQQHYIRPATPEELLDEVKRRLGYAPFVYDSTESWAEPRAMVPNDLAE